MPVPTNASISKAQGRPRQGIARSNAVQTGVRVAKSFFVGTCWFEDGITLSYKTSLTYKISLSCKI